MQSTQKLNRINSAIIDPGKIAMVVFHWLTESYYTNDLRLDNFFIIFTLKRLSSKYLKKKHLNLHLENVQKLIHDLKPSHI